MHASGLSLISIAIVLLLTAATGCRSTRSDNSVQVTQAPAAQQAEIQPPPSRLASGGGTQPASASISDSDEAAYAQLAALESSGMIDGADEGASRAAFMEAFREADPQVREAFRRRLMATVAKQPVDAAAPSAAADQPVAPDQPAASGQQSAPEQQAVAPAANAVANAAGADTAGDAAPESAVSEADPLAGFVLPTSAHHPASAANADALVASRQSQQPEQLAADSAAAPAAPAASAAATAAAAADPSAAAAAEEGNSAAADVAAASPTDEPSAADGGPVLSEAQLLEALIDRWASAAADETETAALRRQFKHRILLTLDGKIDQAVQPIDGMGASEQEYLRHQLLALWTAIDPAGHPVPQRRWSAALPQLREATNYLAAATGKLEVRALTFCTEVESYGRVTPFESTRFAAGQQVILYSELENFAAERLSDGYETHFQGAYEVFDPSGKRVADRVLPADRQICNNYRRDYFIAYRLHLPSQLPPGHYRMEVTMEDLKGKKYGQSNIEFEIVAER